MSRAYTRIDNARVVVGNDWIERHWSELFGKTMELRQKLPGGYVEWIAAPAPDVRLELSCEPMRPDPPAWSESCDEFGAWVTARMPGPCWSVTVHTMALHEHPGLVRTVEIANVGSEPLEVTGVATDVLALRRDGAGVLTGGLQRRSGDARLVSEDRVVAAELQGHGRLGLLLGLEQGGRYELFFPDPSKCALSLPAPVVIAPGRVARLPRSFVMPYSGDPTPLIPGRVADLLRLLHARTHLENDRAADTA